MSEPIAIVGVGGLFPSCPDLKTYWRTIERGVDTAREAPAGRWVLPPDQAFQAGDPAPDRVYSTRACFLEPFTPDLTGIRLDGADLARLDPSVQLAVHLGGTAYRDAGLSHVDPNRVAVMVGNIALPTEGASRIAEGLLGASLEQDFTRGSGRQLPGSAFAGSADERNHWAVASPVGIMAQALGLGGAHLALDAACASSLFSIYLAMCALREGRADAVMAGGLSRPDALYTQMGFSQLQALSARGKCAPFDHQGDGLVVGEGGAFFMLRRLYDALANDEKVYAVIKGVGLSNDVDGRLLAPSVEGQTRALQAAYRSAGWKPSEVDLFECHATGTPLGDATEFRSLCNLVYGDSYRTEGCVIGSVKSNVGHLLTGAGAASLAKVIMAIQHATLPPTANFEKPSEQIALRGSPFRVQKEATAWPTPEGRPRRAAINGFGFGGTNAHVLVEEWTGRNDPGMVSRTLFERSAEPPLARTESAGTSRRPVEVIGMGAHVGPFKNRQALCHRLMSEKRASGAKRKRNYWSQPDAPRGYFLEELEIPVGRFRIPPRELEEAMVQQTLMLDVALEALADAAVLDDDHRLPEHVGLRTGVFVGLSLDPNTTNFNLRWAGLANGLTEAMAKNGVEPDELLDQLSAPLNANRTMGALGSIVASRVAREFGVGGPCFALSTEESSGLTAFDVAFRALERGDIDLAVVGAVDLLADPRTVMAIQALKRVTDRARPFCRESDGMMLSEGAAAVVLKRGDLELASRARALVRGVGSGHRWCCGWA